MVTATENEEASNFNLEEHIDAFANSLISRYV